MAREVFYQVQAIPRGCRSWRVVAYGTGASAIGFAKRLVCLPWAGSIDKALRRHPAKRARLVRQTFDGQSPAPVCEVVWDSEESGNG